ncbi:neutral zinc metallopeptidase [Modestobacter sp. SYSU DS0657]
MRRGRCQHAPRGRRQRSQQQRTRRPDGDAAPGERRSGTSAVQRRRWSTAGFATGDPARCDTFAVDDLG